MHVLPVDTLPLIEHDLVSEVVRREALQIQALAYDTTNFHTHIATTNSKPVLPQRNDAYFDYQMLPDLPGEDVAFLGGTDYLGLFLKTTSGLGARRTVFYQSSRVPVAGGCDLRRFETRARTNWHYLSAQAILDGTEQLPGPAA